MHRRANHLRAVPGGDPEQPSDTDLVDAARRGEPIATRTLYRRYTRMVNGLAFRLLGHQRDLDDVVQEVFLRAFTRLSSLEDARAFPGWIRSIVVRTVHDHLEKQGRRSRLLGGHPPAIDPDSLVAPSAPPDLAADIRAVYATLQHLSIEERTVLVLCHIEEHSVAEVSELTGLSESTVRRRLVAAETRLAKKRRAWP
jgi:RNA polymerase sigma-70 factor, ECF subfamily